MNAAIRFAVRVPDPHAHLFCVTMEIDGLSPTCEELTVCMPVWTPGSYLVREYARHVQGFGATDAHGARLATAKVDKARWRIATKGARSVSVRYDVYAHDISVRTNHLDDSHGFFTGAALFMYPEGRLGERVEVTVEPPPGWKVHCSLDAVEGGANRWHAPDFDVLLDSPVEMGTGAELAFEVDGIPHRVVFWGQGNYNPERVVADLTRIVEVHARMFGGLPYKRYLFIVHLTDNGFGGLEHLNSTVLLYPRLGFSMNDPASSTVEGRYLEFLRLACHEHFHVWNVKRIRPAVLGPFDYQNENYTRELWSIEGVTSYYDTLSLLRAGIMDARKYLESLGERVRMLHDVPGRRLHSLEDASFDAWIKYYRPDENTNNSSVSYYVKGELVALLLDLWMREKTAGMRSLDDVMVHLWRHMFLADGSGYNEGAYEGLVRELSSADPSEFFDRYVRGCEELDWAGALVAVGLEMSGVHKSGKAANWLGVQLRWTEGRSVVSFVPSAGPGHTGGLYAGDELVAIETMRITESGFADTLARFAPGERVRVHLFRRGTLVEREVRLGTSPPDLYRVRRVEGAADSTQTLLEGWLGESVQQLS